MTDAETPDDPTLARQVGATLGMEIPQPCVAGVAMNTRLLAGHLATLRREPEDGK